MRILVFVLLLLPIAVHAEAERWYQLKYCKGEVEHRLSDGARVDCLTETHAIEYDFGYKWAECYGQATFYAIKTRRLPGCVLINERGKYNHNHLMRLRETVPPWFKIWLIDANGLTEIK